MPRYLFLDNSTKLESTTDLESRARGGMVTSLFRVTDFLASEGCDVSVLSDIKIPGVTAAGTQWVEEPDGHYDVLVLNRGVGSGYPQISATARVLWTHDLPHSGFIPNSKTMNAFACVVFMSKYAERIWRRFTPTIGASRLIPNGIDTKLFYFETDEKELDYMIYASAPNRGLKRLPFIDEGIRAMTGRDSVYTQAFSNMSSLHPNEEDIYELDYKEVTESEVLLNDPLPQAEFAAELRRASLMLLPSSYPEICSNTVLQSLACGTPIITTDHLGATPEWVSKKNGRLIDWMPHDYMIYQAEFIRRASEVLTNFSLHKKLMCGAIDTNNILSWEEVGYRWKKTLRRLF